MTSIQAIILGVIQGVSEFLPISSSGHLVFVPLLFGWEVQDRVFDVVVHLGTLLAVFVYFRKKIVDIFYACIRFRTPSFERMLGIALVVSTIPAGIVGFVWGDWIGVHARSASVIGYSFIFWGLILLIADRYANKVPIPRTLSALRLKDALFIGCAQIISLIPGTSRSGITMTAGLFRKFSRTAAAEFSFFMSIPITVLAGAVAIKDVMMNEVVGIHMSIMAIGLISSLVSGFLSIWIVLAVVKRMSYAPFVWYRIGVGVCILWFLV